MRSSDWRRRSRRSGGVPAPETLTILAVVARIIANPVSDVFQKQLAQRSAEPLFTIVATHGLLTALALPFLAGMPLGAAPREWDIAEVSHLPRPKASSLELLGSPGPPRGAPESQ